MPDCDNLPRTLSRAWREAYKAARYGPEFLAKFLAHTTVKELPKSQGLFLLEPLAFQLQKIMQLPVEERVRAVLEPPLGSEQCRDTLIAVHAAEHVLSEIVTAHRQTLTSEEVRVRLYETFCLEIPRVYCLGVLSVKGIPNPYLNVEMACQQIIKCESLLQRELAHTAQELAVCPTAPDLSPISKPQRKRLSQPELVDSTLSVNLSALGLIQENS